MRTFKEILFDMGYDKPQKHRAVDTGGARGATAPPLFCRIILFFFLQNIVFHHRVYGFYISIIGFIAF